MPAQGIELRFPGGSNSILLFRSSSDDQSPTGYGTNDGRENRPASPPRAKKPVIHLVPGVLLDWPWLRAAVHVGRPGLARARRGVGPGEPSLWPELAAEVSLTQEREGFVARGEAHRVAELLAEVPATGGGGGVAEPAFRT